jgi:mRNA interferase MazF
VISGARYHRKRPDYIIMAVTSRTRSMPALGEVIVQNWQKAGLLKPSMIKPVITTIERSLALRRLGSLDAENQTVLRGAISDILG